MRVGSVLTSMVAGQAIQWMLAILTLIANGERNMVFVEGWLGYFREGRELGQTDSAFGLVCLVNRRKGLMLKQQRGL